MRRIFHKIHLYLSIPFGIIITIICLTGAILVFEDEVTMALKKELYYSEKATVIPCSIDSLLSVADTSLQEGVQITGITVFADSMRTCKVSLSHPRRAALFVDRYTGEIKGNYERIPFFDYVLRAHRWLLDDRSEEVPFTIGRRIVGISVLVFVIILASGLVIWIPRSVKALKNRLRVMTGKGMRRFLYDMHVSAGFYSFLILLVLAVTGLTWSFPVYRSFVYDVFGDEKEGKMDLPAPADDYDKEKVFAAWNNVYDSLSIKHKGKDITLAHGFANVTNGRLGDSYASDTYILNQETGAVEDFVPYSEKSRSVKIKGWILSLHTGSWGGLPVKILVFVISLIGASLPITGYYLWIRRIRNRR